MLLNLFPMSEEVETIVTVLISMDFTYKQIEQMLNDRFIKKLE